MIDIKKAEDEFKRYSAKYDMSEYKIAMKYYHTFRVENICEKIAISLGLDKEEVNLAKLIGLLHDIARFEQYTRYETYNDLKSIDHGNFGVKILEENNYIRKYVETDKYDYIILKAIENHNKYCIEENLDEKTKMFCNIVRDADKLDIMYLATFELWSDVKGKIESQTISPEVIQQFMSKQIINREYVINDIDRVVVNIAFIFDYNFKENYEIIKKENYIEKTINRFNFKKEETKKQIELIRKIANEYIDDQIKKN